MAARNAEGVFSMTAFAACSPRCAIGRAISQSSCRTESSGLNDCVDFHGGIAGQHSDADGCARMAAFFSEYLNHEIGRAVHHFWALEKAWIGIDKAAKPYHTCHPIKIAERGFYLGKDIDCAGACRLLAVIQ